MISKTVEHLLHGLHNLRADHQIAYVELGRVAAVPKSGQSDGSPNSSARSELLVSHRAAARENGQIHCSKHTSIPVLNSRPVRRHFVLFHERRGEELHSKPSGPLAITAESVLPA